MTQLLQVVTCDLLFIDFSLWNRNVGHGNSWYSGPFIFMKRSLGVIIQDGNTYAPCVGNDYQACREKICACHRAGVILNSMPTPTELTLKGHSLWVAHAAQELAVVHPWPQSRWGIWRTMDFAL